MKSMALTILVTPTIIIVMFLFPTYPLFAESLCNEVDTESLLTFAHNLSTNTPLDWSVSDCCLWEGIRCDDDHRVTSLWLPSRGLRGNLTPLSLANLNRLSQLNLSHNFLLGSLPSDFFSKLAKLQVIDLSYNLIQGYLPYIDSVQDNPVLRTVDLSSNSLEETIPMESLMSSLTSFNVSNNSFTGTIPVSVFCGNIGINKTSLVRYLDFSYNEFQGEIELGLGGCSELRELRAGFNNLSGVIPGDIFDIFTLEHISLPANGFSGSIGEGVVRLINLKTLELFSNRLRGSIPSNIGKLVNLEKLSLHINIFTGKLPSSLANCTRLSTLNLRVNGLTGELSAVDFSRLQLLRTLDLANNDFTGEIPRSLFSCDSLTAVRFAANQLRGEVPPEISSLQSLAYFSISNNNFTNIAGAMNALKNIKTLTALIMSKNFIKEAMPEDESIVVPDGFQNLKVLSIGACYIRGEIPMWLAKLQKLQVLDLSANSISGTIPGWLGKFPNMFYLDLSVNHLSGEFPKELCSLQALTTGLPRNVTMPYLELPVFVMPNNATNQQYNQLSNLPLAIYLSNNNLTGSIPAEIGQLKFLHVLELNNNIFTGTIPDQFSSLTNLERLDLSRNNLTGQIPSSLKVLHFLSYFSVAYNDLQGPVPTGGQFSTFVGSSYDGNPGLCGPPAVQRSCSQPLPKMPIKNRGKSRKNVIILVLGVYLGTGLIVTVVSLWILLWHTRRANSNRVHTNTNPDSIDDEATNLVTLFPDSSIEIRNLTITEILKATDSFSGSNIIACGSCSLVYKATLSNGYKLAIKKLQGDFDLTQAEFKARMNILSKLKHDNLVSLLGYCFHNKFLLLLYPYMENRSLDFSLHENPRSEMKLDWPTRLKIVKGVSSGLDYINQTNTQLSIVTSSKILLDERFEPRVSHFGSSQLILPEESIEVSVGQEVHSFGVVMLELLTGKRAVDVFGPNMGPQELVRWVQRMKIEGIERQVFDDILLGEKGFEGEMLRVLDLACACVHRNIS